VPVAGDQVRWVVNDKVNTGRVKSRLISYGRANTIGFDTADKVNMRAALSVPLDN
jgi:hypothetical protein